MSYLDIGIAAVTVAFALWGLWKGLIRTLLSIVASAAAIIAAYFLTDPLAVWIAQYFPWADTARQSAAFLFIMIVVNRLVSFIFWVVDKLFGFLWRLPFVNSLNRLLGMLFALIECVAVLGVLAAFIVAHPLTGWVSAQLATSRAVPYLAPIGAALLPGVTSISSQLERLRELQGLLPIDSSTVVNFISSTVK